MKFYLALDEEGCKQLRGTQDDIKLVDKKKFEVVDIPTDKAGLQELVQDSFNRIFELEAQVRTLKLASGIPADEEIDTSEISEADEEFFKTTELKLPVPSQPLSYIGWSIETEENFARLPLAHQLSLAQGALERARESEALCRRVDDATENRDTIPCPPIGTPCLIPLCWL